MRQFVLREKSQCRALYAYLRHNWPAMAAQGKLLAVTVTEHKDKRHAQQNRLYWALLKQVSEQAMVDGRMFWVIWWSVEKERQLLQNLNLSQSAEIQRLLNLLNGDEK